MSQRKGTLCVLCCYILWGLLAIYWKQLQMLSSVYVLCQRIVWSAAFLFTVLAATHQLDQVKAVLRDRKQMRTLLITGVIITGNWGIFIYAVSSNHMLDAGLAYFLNPLFVVLIGAVVYHEKLKPLQWAAIAIAAIGLAYAFLYYGSFPTLSVAIGGSFAIYGTLKKDIHCSGTVSTFIEALLVLPPALIAILFFECGGTGAVGTLSGFQWILLPVAGIVTAVPLLLYSVGIKAVPMSLSGVLMYINPSLQVTVGLLYGEKLGTARTITLICALAGLVLFLLSSRQKKPV